jgi:predicted Zn-dependent peptidase
MLMISGDSDNPEAIREAIWEQAQVLVKEGIPEADFRRMNRSALGRRIKALDSFDSTCFRLCAYHMTDFDYFDFPRVQESVSAEDVRNFLAEVIRRDNCALSVIYPFNQEESHESH